MSGRGQCHESVKAGSGLRSSFGVRAWTEMEIRCVKGKHRLKIVALKIIQGLKGKKTVAADVSVRCRGARSQ